MTDDLLARRLAEHAATLAAHLAAPPPPPPAWRAWLDEHAALP